MLKKTILRLSFITLFIATSALANSTNSCIQQMDHKIGTLYLCGAGGKFKILSLGECDLQDKDMPEVAAYLDKHPRINALELGENDLSDEGMMALSHNKTLAWLSVNFNPHIGDKGAAAIAQIPTLTHLDMIADSVGKEGGAALAGTTLKALNLMRNNIGSEGAAALAKNTTLEIIYADDNRIGAQGASAFANNTSITHLYLAGNNIDDATAIALAKNSHLTELGLGRNNIHDKGAIALANNTTLRWLYLYYNHIGSAGLAALENNTTLVEAATDENDGNNGNTGKHPQLVKMIRPPISYACEKP